MSEKPLLAVYYNYKIPSNLKINKEAEEIKMGDLWEAPVIGLM